MRMALTAAVIAGGLAMAAAAQASVITMSMTATPVAGTPGLYNVDLYAQVSGVNGAGSDGGVSGFQFDVISDGHGASNSVAAALVGPNALKVKNTFDPAVADGAAFATIDPQRKDITQDLAPANPAYASDTDFDLLGGSFSDTGKFKTTTLGVGSPAHITQFQWQLANPNVGDHLSVFIISPTAYNFNQTNSNFQEPITQIVTGPGVTLAAVPEPASLGLLGLGALGLVARRRRA